MTREPLVNVKLYPSLNKPILEAAEEEEKRGTFAEEQNAKFGNRQIEQSDQVDFSRDVYDEEIDETEQDAMPH